MTAMHSPEISRRTMLRGTVTIAGTAVVLPPLSILAGCQAAPASLDQHMALVSAIVGRIIPATDTPGAIEAGVPEYVAAVFDGHLTADQQASFTSGLVEIAAVSREAGASGFADASPATQDRILKQLADGEKGTAAKDTWQQLHDMTVFAFYTSETAKQELAYEEIPGRQVGCLPFEEIGRAWLDRGV